METALSPEIKRPLPRDSQDLERKLNHASHISVTSGATGDKLWTRFRPLLFRGGAYARAACGGSLMADWQLRLRQLCFVAAEFAVATAFVVTFAAAVKYGL